MPLRGKDGRGRAERVQAAGNGPLHGWRLRGRRPQPQGDQRRTLQRSQPEHHVQPSAGASSDRQQRGGTPRRIRSGAMYPSIGRLRKMSMEMRILVAGSSVTLQPLRRYRLRPHRWANASTPLATGQVSQLYRHRGPKVPLGSIHLPMQFRRRSARSTSRTDTLTSCIRDSRPQGAREWSNPPRLPPFLDAGLQG